MTIRRVLTGRSTGASLGLVSSAADSCVLHAFDATGLAVREADLRTSIRPTVAEIDLGALRRNVACVRAIVGPKVAIYGVVKADAYGHGAVAVAGVLAPLVDALAVSLVEEGLELRGAGLTCPILVLGAYYGHTHSEVLEEGLTPVVYDVGELQRFGAAPRRRRSRRGQSAAAGGLQQRWPVHVKIDTGMNRLGIQPEGLPAFLELAARYPHLELTGLCTHFASADLKRPGATREQIARFERCLVAAADRGLVPDVVHAANSAAAVRFPDARYRAIRPGLALYGAMPSAVVARPELEPVLALRTKVMALHEVAAGQGVSYGGLWRPARKARVATLPIGYADGYPRHIRGAEVLIRGRRAPVVGAVCMDMMMIDVSQVKGASVGDPVTLIGRDDRAAITVDQVARWADTASYEILCGISKRVPRIYRTCQADARP
ncbi:MAG TPA: alanine racemase [Polyangia bacterium]|nr:alanine racemase [Polyangia bacterium]